MDYFWHNQAFVAYLLEPIWLFFKLFSGFSFLITSPQYTNINVDVGMVEKRQIVQQHVHTTQ